MKATTKLILITCIAFFAQSSFINAQNITSKNDTVNRLIDTILNYSKNNSLYRKRVNWQSIADSVRTTAAKATTVKEAMPAVEQLYRLLGDHHGFITYGKTNYSWKAGNKPLDKASHLALIKKYREGFQLSAKTLENGYGYLLIPNNNPTHPGDIAKIGQDIQNALGLLNPDKLKGLIIDLRLNTGGSIWPMIGGLAPLFDEGALGSFVFAASTNKEEWGIRKGLIYDGADTVYHINYNGKRLNKLKVVLLIGPYTCSSAEALAISFKGRRNTFFIGENTGGYTTSNESVQFNNNIGFFLATSVEADRNGQLYLDNVKPDAEIIGGDDFDDLQRDQKIIAAIKWLKGR